MTHRTLTYDFINEGGNGTRTEGIHKRHVISEEEKVGVSLLKKSTKNAILINTKNGRHAAPLLTEVAKFNGWKETNIDGKGDVQWAGNDKFDDYSEVITKRSKMAYSKIPDFKSVATKSELGNIMKFWRKFYPDEYNFVPMTFLMPQEDEEVKKVVSKKKRTWVCKPSSGAQGDGLQLINELWEVNELLKRDEYIIQEYIEYPFLIDKKKFDLRIYVVLYGIEPMTAYLCDEGMARFCTVDYEPPCAKNKRNQFMHLSNYSINKYSENYVKNENDPEVHATKRKLSDVYKSIISEKSNGDEIVSKIKENIANVCSKTINAIHATVLNNVEVEFKDYKEIKSSLFHVVGVDIILDQKFNAKLLEINNSPSMNILFEKEFSEEEPELCEIDKEIKLPLLSDVITLANKFRKDNSALESIDEYGCLKKIYTNSVFDPNPDLSVQHNLKRIYNCCTGLKGKASLTSGQFTKIFTNSKFIKTCNLVKHDMGIVFTSVLGKMKTVMDFSDFCAAMFKLFIKAKGSKSDKSKEDDEPIESKFPEFIETIAIEMEA